MGPMRFDGLVTAIILGLIYEALGFFNIIVFVFHTTTSYFGQLGTIALLLTPINVYWSYRSKRYYAHHPRSLIFSRFYIVSLAIGAVVIIGFWGLRIFFKKGIIPEDDQRGWIAKVVSLWVHGGSFVHLLIVGSIKHWHI